MSVTRRNRIAVALCTYNGERFLPEQLASISKQSRLPDEIVVCDDNSSDQSVAMVREFAASVSYPVRIYENDRNLGFAGNFEGAIRRCEGDLIALSDQDDIWYPTRLERCEREFDDHPEVGLVFSDADLIDEHGQMRGQTIWQKLGFAGKRKHDLLAGQFVILAKHRFVTGATVMFRTSLRDRLLPIGAGWIHDEWIAMIAAAFSDLLPIEEPLIRYRTHGNQQIGFQNKLEKRSKQRVQQGLLEKTRGAMHWDRVSESANELQQLCAALSLTPLGQNGEVLSAYRRHLQFLRFRSELPARRLARLSPVLARYGQYAVHASGLASVLKDLVLDRPR